MGETEKSVKIPLINQENRALEEFLMNAGNFEWTDPNAKNGTFTFGRSGKLTGKIGND